MLPSLQIGPFALPTGPLLLIIGLYAGLWLAARVAVRRGLDPDHLYNAGFYAALAAIAGGRLGHIARFPAAYLGDPLSVLSPNFAAFDLWFAAAAALLVLAWYQRRYRVPPRALFDALATGALLALAAAALADLLNGRAFGAPSMLPWSVVQWNVYRHPVQLYELAGTLIVAGWVWRGLARMRPGEAGLAATAGYAAVLLFVDAFRGDPALVGDGFRLSQVVALVVLLLALLALYQMRSPQEAGEERISLQWEEGRGVNE